MRVIDAGGDEVTGLGFAPVTNVLVANVLGGRGFLALGPVGAGPVTQLGGELLGDAFAFTPCGEVVWEDDGLRWTDFSGTVRDYPLPGESGVQVRCGFSADFTRLVTAHRAHDQVRHVGWRFADREWKREWVTPHDPCGGAIMGLCPTGRRFAYVLRRAVGDTSISTRSAETGELEAESRYPYSSGYWWHRLLFSPDGRLLLTIHSASLVVWRVPEMGTPRRVPNDAGKHFTAAAFHPDARHLFTASYDGTVAVWDTEAWRVVKRFAWNVGRLRSVAVSPDGTLAAAGSEKARIVVWDLDL